MTYQALMLAIARLIVQRAEAHGNTAEQERINAKLDRLYALKATMLEQLDENERAKFLIRIDEENKAKEETK